MVTDLRSAEVEELRVALLEAQRTTNRKNPRFLEPRTGALRDATARRDVVIFGRRGSGKTSLLSKAENELAAEGHPTVWVDMENYKTHRYPDVLISILVEIFEELVEWVERHSEGRTSWWTRLVSRKKASVSDKVEMRHRILRELRSSIAELRHLLNSQDNVAERKTIRVRSEDTTAASVSAKATAGDIGVATGAKAAKTEETAAEVERTQSTDKLDYITRKKRDYLKLLERIRDFSGKDCFLFVDDLYQIDRPVQPKILDYFHGLTKGTSLWMKIGTIRHRTDLYKQEGGRPIGLELTHDASDVDLDLSLEKFNITRKFLFDVLQNIADDKGIRETAKLFTEGARDRLVLASGGVARDFITIVGKAIEAAKNDERAPAIVDAEHVNQAAGAMETSKRTEMHADAAAERGAIEAEYDLVLTFCLDLRNTNCFLFDVNAPSSHATRIQELADLRMIHKISSRTSAIHRQRELFDAYVIDLGKYSSDRIKRGLEFIEFWKKSEADKIRRTSLVYEPWKDDYRAELAALKAKKARKVDLSSSKPEQGENQQKLDAFAPSS